MQNQLQNMHRLNSVRSVTERASIELYAESVTERASIELYAESITERASGFNYVCFRMLLVCGQRIPLLGLFSGSEHRTD